MSPPLTTILGTGSPEGVVTAVVGARYVDLSGTALTGVQYRKVSGTGNTGWLSDVPADLSVLARQLSDLARTGGWLPTNAIAETFNHGQVVSNTLTVLVSGTMRMIGGLTIPGGRAVSSISLLAGSTSGASLTHSFVALYDKATLNLQATTEDLTGSGWTGQTARTWRVATALRGGTPGGTWTPASGMEVYVALTVIGTTMPTLSGRATLGAAGGIGNGLFADATGSGAGLTALADIPATAVVGAEISGSAYAYAS